VVPRAYQEEIGSTGPAPETQEAEKGSLLIKVLLLTRLPIANSMHTSTYTCFTPYLDCLFIISMLYTLDQSLSSPYRFVILPSTKGVKVCICDAEEHGLPSMSVKSTPKFENRALLG